MTLGVVRRARSGEHWRIVSSEHGRHSPNAPHGKESCPILNTGDMELVGVNEYDLHRDLESSIEQATLRTHIRDSHLHD